MDWADKDAVNTSLHSVDILLTVWTELTKRLSIHHCPQWRYYSLSGLSWQEGHQYITTLSRDTTHCLDWADRNVANTSLHSVEILLTVWTELTGMLSIHHCTQWRYYSLYGLNWQEGCQYITKISKYTTDCLDWADREVVNTSLHSVEILLTSGLSRQGGSQYINTLSREPTHYLDWAGREVDNTSLHLVKIQLTIWTELTERLSIHHCTPWR
jgi:hypothetical protein